VFSDEQVLPLLEQWGDEAATIFQDVRIPACRADVARLVLLHKYGGLYVDAHCAPGAPDKLALVLARLSGCELIIFDESAHLSEHRHAWIMNSVLCARANAHVLDTLIRRAFLNLAQHRQLECVSRQDRVEYEIYKLTGPWMIWHELFQRSPIGAELKPQYRDRVSIWPFDSSADTQPVHIYQHNGYRTPATHWSRRQKTERLFLSTAEQNQAGADV
jgi:hypothetical protein